MDLMFLIVKLIFALIVVFALMYLSFKLSENKMRNISDTKYIKILERTQISRDSSILVVKVGKKGYILSNSGSKIEKLDDLPEEEILSLEKNKEKQKEKLNEKYESIISNIKSKFNEFNKKITKRKNL